MPFERRERALGKEIVSFPDWEFGNEIKAVMDPSMVCTLCQDPFGRDENIINSGGQVWHEGCFV